MRYSNLDLQIKLDVLRRRDHLVDQLLSVCDRGQCTFTDALIEVVLALAEQNEGLFLELAESVARLRPDVAMDARKEG
jgi:hypothetical protein